MTQHSTHPKHHWNDENNSFDATHPCVQIIWMWHVENDFFTWWKLLVCRMSHQSCYLEHHKKIKVHLHRKVFLFAIFFVITNKVELFLVSIFSALDVILTTARFKLEIFASAMKVKLIVVILSRFCVYHQRVLTTNSEKCDFSTWKKFSELAKQKNHSIVALAQRECFNQLKLAQTSLEKSVWITKNNK